MKRIAVVLFNLGGPDNLAAVRPFLINLFSDPAIIRLPTPLRQFIAHIIVNRRVEKATEIYAKIGNGSPIVKNTQKQAEALQKSLTGENDVRCFVAMRYWHPYSSETIRALEDFKPDEIVLLPLYPQYSTTTSASSLKDFWASVQSDDGYIHAHWGNEIKVRTICCYPEEPGFIKTIVARTRAAYEKAKTHAKSRIIFSAHGLPKKIVKAGDPYQYHCERTCTALVQEMNIPDLDWVLAYQSRVGPLTWIGPSVEEEIERAGREQRSVIIVPVAFVSEHSETLYEIDVFYRALAATKAVPYFDRVATVDTDPVFIEGLAQLVRKALTNTEACQSAKGGRLCPSHFSGCVMVAMKEKNA